MTDRFDELIREAAPEVPDTKVTRQVNRALMHECIRRDHPRRKRNYRLGLVAAGLALVVVFSGQVQDVGSDGFNMIQIEDSKVPGGVVKNEFRGRGFNVLEGETEQDIQETNLQVSADEGIVVEVEGWLLDGDYYWVIKRKYLINGKEKFLYGATKTPKFFPSKKLTAFLISDEWDNILQEIQVGEIPSGRITKIELDGVWFSAQAWPFSTSDSKDGTYYLGQPIR